MSLVFFIISYIWSIIDAFDPCLTIFWISDCDASKLLEIPDSDPRGSPCLAFKNGNNLCGEGPKSPIQIYRTILKKDASSPSITKFGNFQNIYEIKYGYKWFYLFYFVLFISIMLFISYFFTDDLTQCKVTCGEGFQTRNIINSEKCIATQYRSCWVGRCKSE